MDSDVVVVGAGAAGLATSIFAAAAVPRLRVRCLDGATHIGAKILVSGGSRCNVTNRSVDERDFWGGSPRAVRSVLKAFPAARAVQWFKELGVPLHEEEDGKMFPDTNRARTVLDALVAEAGRLGVRIDVGRRVRDIDRAQHGFEIACADGQVYRASAVVLATGGRSLPKTGSDGVGYGLASELGHHIVETTPALVPLVLGGDRHRSLSGVSHAAALTLWVEGRTVVRLVGSLLWTHVGASGPVVLNLSRHWHRARLAVADPSAVAVRLSVCPEDSTESLDRWLVGWGRDRPRSRVATALATRLPTAVVHTWMRTSGLSVDATMTRLTRDDRRRLVRALVETPLDVLDSRGYAKAEATAGGVSLDEVDPATMESRRCPGLFLVGEMLDVDGRLGGFNFQWAWASAWVAGHGLARHHM